METYRAEITLAFVAVYMLLCVVVGLWAMRKTHSAGDFFVAGRGLGPMVIAFAIFSSTLSGFGFVGGPGLVYSSGMSSVWMICVSTFGYALGFFLVAKRIRMIAEVREAVSLPDIVAARYDSRTVTVLTALTIVLGVMGYLATQILAMAVVLQSVLSALPMFEGISLVTCIAISASVLVFYCVTGGIIASVYTDLFQGAIMAVAGVLILIAAAQVFDGGIQEASEIIFADEPEAIMPFGSLGFMTCLGWFFVFGLGLAGQPHLITKMMMNRKISDNRTILPLSLVAYALAALLWLSIGVVMKAVVIDGAVDPLATSDLAAPSFLSLFAHPLLAGLVFAALFAAIMSTSDAFLNIGVAAIVHDIPKALRGRSLGNELTAARIWTVLLALIATGFAVFSFYVNDRLVALLGAFGWSTFAAVIVPVVAIGLNWKRAHPVAAIGAILVSLAINLGFEFAAISLPYGIVSGYIAVLGSLITFFALSLAFKPRRIAPDIDAVMNL